MSCIDGQSKDLRCVIRRRYRQAPSGSQQWRDEQVVWQTYPMGDAKRRRQGALIEGRQETEPLQVVDTLGGRMHVRWDMSAAATPDGQYVFFAEFLAATGMFERWVSACSGVPTNSKRRHADGVISYSWLCDINPILGLKVQKGPSR